MTGYLTTQNIISFYYYIGKKKRRAGRVIRDSTSEEPSEEEVEEEEGLLSPAGSVTELQAAVQSGSGMARTGKRNHGIIAV